ncbi:hypothetical protein [Mycobacterium sp. NPDC050041]|uniref:hypothetical protein n=1 Tax=Mycobacterium sp. NPDC050041 TaxID=3364293 RepID=UPI003C2D5EB4
MTTPIPVPDLSGLIPSKAKALVALIGAGLSFIVPFVLEVSTTLPDPWPAVIGGVLWLLTAFGVLQRPFLKPGTVVVAAEDVKPGATVVTPKGAVGTKPTDGPYDHVATRPNTSTANAPLSGYTNPFPPLT